MVGVTRNLDVTQTVSRQNFSFTLKTIIACGGNGA
jgi:hypothetical protein